MLQTLVDGKYFRVHTIATITGIRPDRSLVFENKNAKYGLAVERKLKNNKYYVISMVVPDGDSIKLEDVDFRTLHLMDETMSMEDFWEMMQEYKNCVEFAKNTVLDLQETN